MKNLKKTISMILAAVLVLVSLTACSSGKKASLTIGVPNDTTNEARALLLLQELGYITLKADAGITATIRDIEKNDYNLEFKEVEAAQLPNVLDDVDYAVINSNYAIEAGLNPSVWKVLLPHTAIFWLLRKAMRMNRRFWR